MNPFAALVRSDAPQGQAGTEQDPDAATGHWRQDEERETMNAIGQISGGNDAKLAVEQKVADIPHQLELLDRKLDGCCKELGELAARLEGAVMRSEPPSPDVNGSTQIMAAPSTPYGARLADMVATAAMLCARIQSMTQRLEV